MATRLVQLVGAAGRRLSVVEEPHLRLLRDLSSIWALAAHCVATGQRAALVVESLSTNETVSYDEVYAGRSEWRMLPAADHPEEPARCLVSGTGLTHMASAKNRDAMHLQQADLTDSMRMYLAGVEGGKPEAGKVGVAPEWFYKGTGTTLRGPNEELTIPGHATDGGEEPEIAGVYWIDGEGHPHRVGMTMGNEFSDHEFERRSYLYLAASKLRECSIGPELVLDAEFGTVPGEVSIERGGKTIWQRAIQSGESVMSHSLANLEHHHFKFEAHRRPGDLHVHFFGADAFSFGDGLRLENGDWMQVRFEGFGRPLRNRLRRMDGEETPVVVAAL